jgi:hypothetical protein
LIGEFEKSDAYAAIQMFKEKKLSLGNTADLAGCNRLGFMDILAFVSDEFLHQTIRIKKAGDSLTQTG